MYTIYEKLKSFLIEKINEKIETQDVDFELMFLNNNSFNFGSVDTSKIISKIFVAIIPETQIEIEDDIEDFCENNEFTITFLFQKNAYETLLKQMCFYASVLRQVCFENPTFSGIDEIEIGERKFYSDCGVTEKTMTAFECSLTIKTSQIFN